MRTTKTGFPRSKCAQLRSGAVAQGLDGWGRVRTGEGSNRGVTREIRTSNVRKLSKEGRIRYICGCSHPQLLCLSERSLSISLSKRGSVEKTLISRTLCIQAPRQSQKAWPGPVSREIG